MHTSDPAETDSARARFAGEQRLGSLMEQSLFGAAELDLSGRHLHVNELLCEMTGYSAEELRGIRFRDLTDPRDAQTDQTVWDTALRIGKASVLEQRFRRKDGTHGWASVSIVLIRDAAEAPQSLVVYVLDITRRKQTELELQRSNERLELAKQAAGQGTWDWDMVTGRLDWSPEIFTLLGLNPDARRPSFSAWEAAMHPEDRASARKSIDESIRDHSLLGSEYRVVHPNGSVRWISAMGRTAYDGAGRPLRVTGICMDVTERREMLDKIQRWNAELERTVAHRTAELAAEHARTTQTLRRVSASESRFRTIFEQAADSLYVHDLSRRILDVNPQACASLGYSREELLRMDLLDVEVGLALDELQTSWRQIDPGHSQTLRGQHRRKDGSTFPVEVRIGVLDLEGERYFIAVARDVSEREQRAKELEGTRNQLFEAQQIAHLGSWEYIAATHETVSTDEQKRIFGLSPNQPSPSYEELLNQYIHPEDAAELDQCFRDAFRNGKTFEAENRIVRPDGSVRFIYNKAQPHLDENGDVARYVGVTLDITDRKQAELELQRSNERLELAKQAAGQGIWDWDIVTGRLDWSPEIFTLLGLNPCARRPSFSAWEAAMHPADRDSARKSIDESIRDHSLLNSEYRVVHPNGSVRWISAMGRAAYDGAGRPLRMTGICMDVTERREMLDKIRRWNVELERTVAFRTAELTASKARTVHALERTTASELRFRTIFEQAPMGIAMIDSLTGQIYALNERFAEIAGRTRDEMVLIDWMSITHPDDVRPDLHNMARLNSGQISGFQMDKRYLRPDGSMVWVRMTIAPVAAESGESPRHLCMIEDITDRKEAEDRIRSITDAAHDAIIMMGPHGTVTYWNPAAEFILGYSAEEAIGVNLHEQLAPERYRAAFRAAFSEFSRTGRGDLVGKRIEMFARRKDGREIPVSISLTAVSLQGTWHSVGILHDITERLAMEEQIRQWNVELERRVADRTVELAVANAAKSEFLANMSHEIRTPMNGVIGMTRLLLDTVLTSEQRRYAETICSSGESMLTLINDILDLSRIEAGKLQLEMIAFDLRTLLDDCVAPLVQRTREKGLEFAWEAAPEIPPRVSGDPGRLRQVLNNLVGNAIKFTDKGKVTVLASLLAENRSDLVIRFAVRDTGIGIPSDKQEAIFKRFSQVDASMTRRFGGTGLGLAIAKELSELMGGEIGVDSQSGIGSEFWFTVRLRRVPRENLKEAAAEEIPSPLPEAFPRLRQCQMRVLVAEDNSVNRDVAIGILGKLGIRADAVADGTEVIEALKSVPYDLVLMDVQMPELDGLAATRIIRNPHSAVMNHRIPVIAVTANAMRGDRERCLEAGMNDYISKPVSPQALTEVLNAWLPSDAHQTHFDGAAGAGESSEFASEGSVFDRAGIVARLMGDEALTDRILSRFLESVPSQIESLRKCVETGNLVAAQRQAHCIKGAASNVGGELLRRLALEIEEAARAGDAAGADRLLAPMAAQFERFRKVVSPSTGGTHAATETPLAVPGAQVSDLAQSACRAASAAHQIERIEGYSGREFDMLDFGAIQLDKDGAILKYNAYEGRLSGRDPARVIGKNFFTDVAPCTDVKEFAGRFRAGVASGDLHETFPYRFVFPDRYVDVEISLISSSDRQGAWIFVEERRSH